METINSSEEKELQDAKDILDKVSGQELRNSLGLLFENFSNKKNQEKDNGSENSRHSGSTEDDFYGRVSDALADNKFKSPFFPGLSSQINNSLSLVNIFADRNLDYDKLFSNIPIMLHLIDKNGDIIAVSHKWLETLGYSYDEVRGRKAVDFFTFDSRQKALQNEINKFGVKGSFSNLHYQMLRKDNATLDVVLSSVALKDDNGDFVCSLAVCFELKNNQHFLDNNYFYIGMPVMAFSFCSNGEVVAMTDSFANQFSLKYEVDKSHKNVINLQQLIADADEVLRHILEKGGCFNLPVQILNKEDESCEAFITANVEKNNTGNNKYINAIVTTYNSSHTDVGDAIKNNEQHVLALKASNIGVWDWDVKTDVFYCSDELINTLVGDTDVEITDFNGLANYFVAKDRVNFLNAVSNHMNHRENLDVTCKLKSSFTKTGWVNIKGNAQRNSKGEVLRVTGTLQDVTSYKDYESTLQRSNEELQHFAYVASHDLQEPLNSIITFSTYLKKNIDNANDKIYESLDYLLKSSYRMKDFIYNLLEYSRLRHEGDSEFEDVNLNSVLDNIKEDYQHKIEKDGVELIIGDLPIVTANRGRIKQLFQNLISNAIKYRKLGKDTRHTVEVFCSSSENMHRISVKDNGIGIDNKYKNIIFKLFERLNPYYDYPGTGIGLAICKKIVEQHEGDIDVISDINQGCEFIVSLPIN